MGKKTSCWLHKWDFCLVYPWSFLSLLCSAGKTLVNSYGQQLAQPLQKDVDQTQSEQTGCENSSQGPAEGTGLAQFGEKEAEDMYDNSILNMATKRERINSSHCGWDQESEMELQPGIKGDTKTNLPKQWLIMNLDCPGRLLSLHPSNLLGLVGQAPLRDDAGMADPAVGHWCGQDVLFRSCQPCFLWWCCFLLRTLASDFIKLGARPNVYDLSWGFCYFSQALSYLGFFEVYLLSSEQNPLYSCSISQ